MSMLHALERQDSAVLGALLDRAGSHELLTLSETAFEDALRKAREHINSPEEDQIASDIQTRYERFRTDRDALLASSQASPLAAYDKDAFPSFDSVKQRVVDLIELNHAAMKTADEEAKDAAHRRAVTHGALVAIALVSLGFLSRAIRRHLLNRLAELESLAEAIQSGDRTRRATVQQQDELGVLARSLNAILDHQQELEATMAGRLGQYRRFFLALLREQSAPSALMTLSGDIVASTLTAVQEKAAREAVSRLDASRDDAEQVVEGDPPLALRPLRVHEKAPAGWLARVATP